MTITKGTCRMYENPAGSVTMYMKREIAEPIMKLFNEKRDYHVAFDSETKTITVKEL